MLLIRHLIDFHISQFDEFLGILWYIQSKDVMIKSWNIDEHKHWNIEIFE